MNTPWMLICATAIFLATGLSGCGDSGSDTPALNRKPAPVPAALSYEATFRDDSELPSGVEPRYYQPLTSVLVDVVVTNRSDHPETAPIMTLRILDQDGKDITPFRGIAAVLPWKLAAGQGYHWQSSWNQENDFYRSVAPGTYTVQVINTLEEGEKGLLTSRLITIRPSLTYDLSTSRTYPIPALSATHFTPIYTVGERIALLCQVGNQGDRPLYPGIDGFRVYDEQVKRNILPLGPLVCQVLNPVAVPEDLSGRFLAPGSQATWSSTWDQAGHYEPDPSSTDPVEWFSPTPGWYRVDLLRRGEVLTSTRFQIVDLPPVVASLHD